MTEDGGCHFTSGWYGVDGDPFVGCGKTLQLAYSCGGGETMTKTVESEAGFQEFTLECVTEAAPTPEPEPEPTPEPTAPPTAPPTPPPTCAKSCQCQMVDHRGACRGYGADAEPSFCPSEYSE